MARIARVVPEVALDRTFDYAVPVEMAEQLRLGAKVRVPFGSREIVGYVVDLAEESTVAALKPIRAILGEPSFLSPILIELARWIAAYYVAPLAVALKSVLPEAVRRADAAFKQRLWVTPLVKTLTPELAAQLGKAKGRRAAWNFLQEQGPGWLAGLIAQSGIGSASWRGLADRNLVAIEPRTAERDPLRDLPAISTPARELNGEQAAALAAIQQEIAMEKPRVVLLHGVTGSGKTEIYLQAIEEVVARGQSALVLVPQIALTPQTVERFRARFVGRAVSVAVLHSHLSRGERHDQWQSIRAGRARVVIGARSAVFAPLQKLGLIVVDEEHDSSYKQEESPHYHGRDIAVLRGHLEGVTVVLGSATPSLESFHHARTGKYRLVELRRRVEEVPMPTMHLLDLRAGKREENPALFAPRLVEAIQARLERQEQAIIFLNRRGFSASLQCPSCGQIELCPHCSIALTYHRAEARLKCHLCANQAPVPSACPMCGAAPFRQVGTGTERVEEKLAQLFPGARVARMDADTMRGKKAYAETLGEFARGTIDILVGTQMIAKGLDFPRVTCVGVVNADLALQIPDFRASERVFQLLMQVAGRSGRGALPGEVFVQTRAPFHPAIQFARHHDYAGFVEQELEFRKSLRYPPFERCALLLVRGRDEEKTRFVAEQIGREIARLEVRGLEVEGPAPAPIARIESNFRYHLFLRTRQMSGVTAQLRPLLLDRAWPDEIRVTLDVDPVDLL